MPRGARVGGHGVFVVPSRDLVVVPRADAAARPVREVDGFTLGAMLRLVVRATD